MSLISDFSNYYVNTWIAIREGEVNHPFLVSEVIQEDGYSRHDYSHEAEQALRFVGTKWSKNEDGRFSNQNVTIAVFHPSIIHESPDVGYLSHGRGLVSWTHINPVRQRVKGLMGNKIRQIQSPRGIEGSLVYNLFNPDFEGLVTRFIFIHPYNGNVYYKGCRVGSVDLNAPMEMGRLPCTLLDKFKHITPDLENYNVTLVGSL